MRHKIAAANWKMHLTMTEAETLLNSLLSNSFHLAPHHEVILAIPAPYLAMAARFVDSVPGFSIAAQNCHSQLSGAYTGEISVPMLKSIGIHHVVLGHSERREYFGESNAFLAEKVNTCLQNEVTPIFCCGESLQIRESGHQNTFVANQLRESLFHLSEADISRIIIAYEPIWAIGTGKTATSDQAQEIQRYLRSSIAEVYTEQVADTIPILYGGSVKGTNAADIFSQPDVDGGLVGGASLNASEFTTIINSLPS
jgi:triosephosphate isomerase